MADPRVSNVPPGGLRRSSGAAGTITKIRLENFMCHSNLQIDFGDYVNFITGQNGSGKSAILTALCVAFGCRAKSTQRASTLKDFIKTDCNYAVIHVEMKNQGEDAFKPEVYGDLIILERKISETSGSVVLKDHLGKKVASGREEIRELVEHFNIDVENPCVIMTQDKSREFLHSGSNKDKFKFFFKATLLQQVDDLLQKIRKLLESANDLVCELEKSIEPILRELKELRGKIKSLEHVEQITEQAKQLKKKLAWSWVYDVDKQLQEQSAKLEKLKNNVPVCHTRIDKNIKIHQDLKDSFVKKKAESDKLLEKTSEVEIMKNELKQNLAMVTRERLQLEGEHSRRTKEIQKMAKHLEALQEQVGDIQEQHMKNTQAEDFEMEEKLRELQDQFDAANSFLLSLKEEENSVSAILSVRTNEIKEIADEVDGYERRLREISSGIREIQQHRTNKVTAFGGERVIQLLRVVERHRQKFKRAPIGPIGGHVNLLNGDAWGFAVENAIGRLLNAFIVTDHKDSLLLRKCAKEAHYEYLQIFIYDFSKPRLNIPDDMLPRTEHLTVLSVLHSENPTVMNVLVDMGNAERQVLVKDYEIGKKVAFGQRIPNLKEVYTIDGYRMFSRGYVQTILPPNKRARTGRLCSSYDVQVKELNSEASSFREKIQQACHKKRVADDEINKIRDNLQCIKRRRLIAERDCMNKKIAVQDQKKSLVAEAGSASAPSVDELHGDISRTEGEIQEKEIMLEKYLQQIRDAEEKQTSLRASLMKLCESAKEDSDALEKVTNELSAIQQEMSTAEKNKAHYEDLLSRKLLPFINEGEEEYHRLEKLRQESCEKASYICPESEVEALGGCKESTPEQLSAQLTRLNQRLQRENQNSVDSLDDLRMLYEKKQKKIMRKQQTFEDFRQKLKACNEALALRHDKFRRNATLLKRQLTWQFNGHLRKKGISGTIRVGYEEKTLSIEVKMPQDASSNVVRDTRGLSGGERSFSTLCFALALHEMTEAPFRAMDEFDVFMDAISRKISLDTLVDFALSQGSQWIFITPHDISMVKQDDRMKKQQMAAPRS